MSTTTKYILYLTVLHLAVGILLYLVIGKGPWLLLAEAALLGSIYLAYRLYQRLIAPTRLLNRGAGALADQDFSVKLRPTGSQEMDGLVDVYNRMIDQLRAERVAGRQREEFLERLVGAAEIGIAILDFDGGIARTNDWLQRRGIDLSPALSLSPGEKRVLTTPDNRRLHVERSAFVDRGFERGFILVQDVTTDLLRAEKEAYGHVIRMMAHEVNNSNAGIASLLQSLLEAASADEPELPELTRKYLPTAIERTGNMTAFMRNFARVVRLPPPDTRPVDLVSIITDTAELMRARLVERAIDLAFGVPEYPVTIPADRAQLEQVLINAITNAAESIGRGGRICLTLDSATKEIIVADDGGGIPPEVAERLFTPFYSTKADGQGVGLTLVRDILEGHGMHYGLRTEADGWTRLRVGW